jgi:nucleotide-binding universal stress UspA family protein
MTGSEHRIVAGIDGSEQSTDALRWAIDQAKRTGATVDAVMAWRFPSAYGWSPGLDDFDLEGDSKKALDRVLTETDTGGVTVRPVVAEGSPADVLVRSSKDADLLIVGSRGRGGLRSAVLGSVSLGCVLRAHCPVLVLREGPDEEEASGPA